MAKKITIRAGSVTAKLQPYDGPPTTRRTDTRQNTVPVKRDSGDDRRIIVFIVMGACLFIFAIVAICSQGGSTQRVRTVRPNDQVVQRTYTPPPSPGFKELNGKTIGQWMKENNTGNNEMNRERQKMLNDFRRTGGQ
ncbi:MAG: hypothetical protein C0404_08490 [Verrucomicrobia bacterium]|nr:hypothetical protein [Verrucomicrobiota bacterium]